MCGRMNISDHEGIQWLLEHLGLSLPADRFTPKYNVSPTAALWGLSVTRAALTLDPMQWGFVPPWAKDGQFKRPLFNARAETIWEKPSFRSLIRRYRGIVPANGFYEWSRTAKNADGKPLRQAHYITVDDAPAIALAAIIQVHGDGYKQCCLITTDANEQMQAVHKRQPVIIEPDSIEAWIENDNTDFVNECLLPIESGRFNIRAVGDHVNNARNDGPECLVQV